MAKVCCVDETQPPCRPCPLAHPTAGRPDYAAGLTPADQLELLVEQINGHLQLPLDYTVARNGTVRARVLLGHTDYAGIPAALEVLEKTWQYIRRQHRC